MCGGCARTGLSLTSRRLANRQGCGDAGGSVQVGRPVLHIAGSLSGLARELCCAWLPVWGEPSVAAAGQGIGRCGCSGPELAFAWPRAWGGRLLASSLEPEQVCYLLRCARRRQRALSRNAGRCAPVPGGGCLEELGYRWMHHGAVHGPGVRNADRSPPGAGSERHRPGFGRLRSLWVPRLLRLLPAAPGLCCAASLLRLPVPLPPDAVWMPTELLNPIIRRRDAGPAVWPWHPSRGMDRQGPG